jgi:hypothetical protein
MYVEINLISLRHLKLNKQASGRLKDLSDLENLPLISTPIGTNNTKNIK